MQCDVSCQGLCSDLLYGKGCNACDVSSQVRGSTTPLEEQAYILQQSHSVGLIAQDAASLHKLLPHIAPAKSLNGNGSSNGSLNGNGAVRAAHASVPLLNSSLCLPAAARAWESSSFQLSTTQRVQR